MNFTKLQKYLHFEINKDKSLVIKLANNPCHFHQFNAWKIAGNSGK
jgi:hypothetical protein